MLEVIPPLREVTPTGPGKNQARAEAARPPIMPTTALSGLSTPRQFGPTKRASASLAALEMASTSQIGTRSGMMTSSLTPAAMASRAADLTIGAGMYRTETSRGPDFSHASWTVSNTGTPSTSCPPLPGVTPATTLVPYSRINLVRAMPSRPVIPCTRTRLVWSIKMDIDSVSLVSNFPQAGGGLLPHHPWNLNATAGLA